MLPPVENDQILTSWPAFPVDRVVSSGLVALRPAS
jgi:hypothetical protein